MGRYAANEWWIRRTDQFHFAFTIQVTAATITPPMAMDAK